MTTTDLGFWSGIILATLPGIKVYQQYGVLAGIGAYIASMYILALLSTIVFSLIFDKRNK